MMATTARPCGVDPGQRFESFLQSGVELLRTCCVVSTQRRIKLEADEVRRPKAWIDLVQPSQALEEEPGADEQHERHDNLNHDERLPYTRPMARRRRARLLLDRRHEIRPCGLKGRDETEPESRCHGYHEVESEDPSIGCRRESQTLLLARCQKDQTSARRVAYEKSEKSSDESQEKALYKELPEDVPPPRPDRHPESDLLAPVGRLRHEQVGHSGTSNEQNKPRQAHHGFERCLEGPPHVRVPLPSRQDDGVGAKKLLLPIGADVGEARLLSLHRHDLLVEHTDGRLGLLSGDSVSETGIDLYPAGSAVVQLVPRRGHLALHRHRNVKFGVKAETHTVEARCRDTDHRHRMSVYPDRLPDDSLIPSEAPAPVVVVQNHDRIGSGSPLVVHREDPPQRGIDSQHLEVIARDELGLHPLRRSSESDVHHLAATAEDPIEDSIPPPVVSVHRIGKHVGPAIAPYVGPLRCDHHKGSRVLDRQHSQKHLVEESEYRRVCADTERQRDYRHPGQERRAGK